MKRRNPYPGVAGVTDRHGKRRWRFRMKGRTGCYLPGDYDSLEFRKAYDRAISGENKPEPTMATIDGSFDWLIQQYFRTPRWQKLANVTRKNLANEIERFRIPYGKAMVADLRPGHVERIVGKLADRPAAANSMLKLIRRFCRFAVKREVIKHDPTVGIERFATNQDGYHTWTDAEIERFEDHHGLDSKQVLALRLMLWTGAARQDVTKLGWQSIRGGRIAYRRRKTGGDVDLNLELMPELVAVLQSLPKDRMLFLGWGKTGRGYTPAGFGNRFRKWCNAAGLPHCASHGLRKAGATRLGDAGASELELQAYLGHLTPDEARTYVKKANRAKLADSGMRKLQSSSNPIERLDNHRRKQLETKEK